MYRLYVLTFLFFFFLVTPTHGPKITGGQPRYQIGDVVRVNCTSAPSKPVCHLSWLINGEPAQRPFLKQYDKIIVGREGLEVARLGLEFRVRASHFKHGDMKLKVSQLQFCHCALATKQLKCQSNVKICLFTFVVLCLILTCVSFYFTSGFVQCVAKISSLYWQSNEESVESDKQQRAPALESRETVAAKSSAHGKV